MLDRVEVESLTTKSYKMSKPKIYLEEYKIKQGAQDYGMADEIWDFEKFKEKFRIVVVR